jgi:hypothetical protein
MTEEQHLDLVERLGMTGDVMILTKESDESALLPTDGFGIVLVEGERIITARHAWGASGAHIDVRTYHGREQPRVTKPVLIATDEEVSIYATNPDD